MFRSESITMQACNKDLTRRRNAEVFDPEVVYLTPKGVARCSGEHYQTVVRAIRVGDLKSLQRSEGRTHYIHPEEAKRWILSRGEEKNAA